MADKATSQYSISQGDLKDPVLYRLNTTFASISGRLTAVEGDGGSSTATSGSSSFVDATGGAPISIVTVHANRSDFNAELYTIGSFLAETDRTVIYQVQLVSNKKTWVYLAGTMSALQSGIPNDLGKNDRGFRCEVTDYGHKLRWGGTAWGFAPGDSQGGYIDGFLVDPTSAGWKLCDGTATTYLKADGTTAAITPPNLLGGVFPKYGAVVSGVNAAVAAIITGSTAAATTGDTVNAASTGASVVTSSTGVAAGAGSALDGAGLSDPGHTHTINDPGHTHAAGTLINGVTGQPPNLVLRPFFRR